MNHGADDDVLVSISTPAATTAEVHETKMEGDVMKMRALEKPLAITAGSTIILEPGGLHVMLTGLKAPLKKGEVVALELMFEKAGVVKLDVPVGEVAAGHEHMD
jgi:periplasmic copper chaperone A